MANIATIGSTSMGHPPYPPSTATGGSSNVMAEGAGVHRVGDSWSLHGNPMSPLEPPHSGTTITGSNTVFCNGFGIARLGDSIQCGPGVDTIGTGKATIMVGG